jgi:hypothetical protein
MLTNLRKIGLAAAMAGVIAVTLPDAAQARWGGGWHGGGWHGGGWSWRRLAWRWLGLGWFRGGSRNWLAARGCYSSLLGRLRLRAVLRVWPVLCGLWRTLRRWLLCHATMGLGWLRPSDLETGASLLLIILHNEKDRSAIGRSSFIH